MSARKKRARSRRHKHCDTSKHHRKAAKRAGARSTNPLSERSWLDRSLDLLKIGVGLANLFFIKS